MVRGQCGIGEWGGGGGGAVVSSQGGSGQGGHHMIMLLCRSKKTLVLTSWGTLTSLWTHTMQIPALL